MDTLFDLAEPEHRVPPTFVIADAGRLPFRADTFQSAVTSPPYWKARDYGHGVDQLGNEDRVVDFVARLVGIFGEVRRVLRPDGCLWVNIGDTYNTRTKLHGGAHNAGLGHSADLVGDSESMTWAEASAAGMVRHSARSGSNLKDKDLAMVPSRFAIAMVDDGWYLRSEIIWDKPWSKPENSPDRPVRTHEHIYLFTRSEQYRYERHADSRSTVWRIPPGGDNDGPAVFPPELVRRCLTASARPGDPVLDPFAGSGTTLRMAERLGMVGFGVDLTANWI